MAFLGDVRAGRRIMVRRFGSACAESARARRILPLHRSALPAARLDRPLREAAVGTTVAGQCALLDQPDLGYLSPSTRTGSAGIKPDRDSAGADHTSESQDRNQ